MNVDEAEHYLTYAISEADLNVAPYMAEEFNKALTIAKIATEKQRPKRPTEIKQKHFTCPVCGLINDLPKTARYCIYCGQALDWSDQ